MFLGPQALVVVVVAGVAAQSSGLTRDHPVDLAVQELAVVRDQQEGLPLRAEVGVEPGEGGDVEVVGGLVEEQEVRVGEQ